MRGSMVPVFKIGTAVLAVSALLCGSASGADEATEMEVPANTPSSSSRGLVVAQAGVPRTMTEAETRSDRMAAQALLPRARPSLVEKLSGDPEALEDVPFGDYIARSQASERAMALRSGPLSSENLNEYREMALRLAEVDPKASKEAMEFYQETRFMLHQDYWVETGNPDVPPTGNFVPALIVVGDAAVDAVTE